VIGNDIVDLRLAAKASNIFRRGYLQKICSSKEVKYIETADESYLAFWRIWTMKESAYKAFQRLHKFEPIFNPFAFDCDPQDSKHGNVLFQGESVSTLSIFNEFYMYSEVFSPDCQQRFFGSTSAFLMYLKNRLSLKEMPHFEKSKLGVPYLYTTQRNFNVSKTHHGHFQVFQY